MSDTDWQPPEFKEHTKRGIPLSTEWHRDSFMAEVCDGLNLKIAQLLNEGAKTFTFQWVNVIDRNDNPDGKNGVLVIKATR